MTVWLEVSAQRVFTVGAIEVVAAGLDAPPEAVRGLSAWLCDAEQRRAARFHFDRDRRRFVVARARLRELLAERLDVPPESIEFVYGREGKPALAERFARSGWRFNLSHCDDLALYAFSRERELGVDVEAIRCVDEADAIGERFFAPGERGALRSLELEERNRGFLRLWTRKEALAKGLGDSLAVPLERLDASAPPRGWSIESFSPEPGFIGALAVQE
jgi:4'-phosphopantetheinyl transferase